MTSYTVCKVMFKGDPSDLPSTSSSSGGEVEHMNNSGGSEGLENPRHFTGLLDAEKETQIGDAIRRAIFDNVSTHDLNALLNFQNDDDELVNRLFMQEDRNDYRPKMSLTGFISDDDDDDDDSDSDLISATTTTGSIQTSSSTYDSFGSSNRRIDQITDLKNSPSSTTKLMSPTQVVSKPLETSLDTSKETKNHYEDVQGTEMAKCEMDEKVINNKRAGFFYRKIQTCIKKILLCSSIPLRT
nr:PREDICTED: NAC domain-containing protein 3-like [Raphanus sativus]